MTMKVRLICGAALGPFYTNPGGTAVLSLSVGINDVSVSDANWLVNSGGVVSSGQGGAGSGQITGPVVVACGYVGATADRPGRIPNNALGLNEFIDTTINKVLVLDGLGVWRDMVTGNPA